MPVDPSLAVPTSLVPVFLSFFVRFDAPSMERSRSLACPSSSRFFLFLHSSAPAHSEASLSQPLPRVGHLHFFHLVIIGVYHHIQSFRVLPPTCTSPQQRLVLSYIPIPKPSTKVSAIVSDKTGKSILFQLCLAILAVPVQYPVMVSPFLLNLNIFLVIFVSHPMMLSIADRLHDQLSPQTEKRCKRGPPFVCISSFTARLCFCKILHLSTMFCELRASVLPRFLVIYPKGSKLYLMMLKLLSTGILCCPSVLLDLVSTCARHPQTRWFRSRSIFPLSFIIVLVNVTVHCNCQPKERVFFFLSASFPHSITCALLIRAKALALRRFLGGCIS